MFIMNVLKFVQLLAVADHFIHEFIENSHYVYRQNKAKETVKKLVRLEKIDLYGLHATRIYI